MTNIGRTEVLDSQQYVTGDMIENAANVMENHYVTCRALSTELICCFCKKRSEMMEQQRQHVTEIIIKRKTMQNNSNVSQYGRDITPAAQDFTKRVNQWQ